MNGLMRERLGSARGIVYLGLLILVSVCSGLLVVRRSLSATLNLHALPDASLSGYAQALVDPVQWSLLLVERSPQLVLKAWAIGFLGLIVVMLLGVALLLLLLKRTTAREGHGSARWATRADIVRAGLLESHVTGTSLIVGGWQDPTARKNAKPEYLVHTGPESATAFAPSGSAKTVALVIPNLLCYESSAFVMDVKGELWRATAGYRHTVLGQKVLFHDPSSSNPDGARFNCLEEVNIDQDTAVKDVQMIAVYLIPSSSDQTQNAHFEDSARSLGVAVILHELSKAYHNGKRSTNIASVLSAITQVDSTIKEYLREMVEYRLGNDNIARVIRETATEMLGREEREFSGVISSLITPLSIFRDPVLAAATASSDFKILDLVEYPDRMTLYLTIRPSDRDRLKHYFALFINLMFRRLTSEMSQEIEHRNELLLMLEEFSSMPPLPVVQQSMDVMRGFGLKAFIILQDVESLNALYGQNETFTSNSKVQIAYTPSKPKTAQLICDMVGTTTVTELTGSQQRKLAALLPSSENHAEGVHSRKLLTQDEVMRLGVPTLNAKNEMIKAGETLVFVRGCRPIRGIQTPYFFDNELKQRAEISAPKKSSQVPHTEPIGDTVQDIDDQLDREHEQRNIEFVE